MLDSETKRRIDTCRNILVGKVPDPKSQVEQITIALIYKFMDDMDSQSVELGGARSFFAGDFQRYRWAKLIAPGVSGADMLSTYQEALAKMVENAGLPVLFRSIFRNAYLPYRDPETLRAFLREIDGFKYDHSERLGDAFEYLLSVLGSQGDAGQFRTPRHIIDFMVEIVAPKKHETILDPACGTAGFLISAYKHILKTNSSDAAAQNGNGGEADAAERTVESPMRYRGDLLSPEEREQLARNIKGYDISPDMVRLSLVNLYLHGFVDPHIDEYDTLTSEEKWTETADVIFANPPFMSPKGGIKPHTRFQVQSKRSEVLFVDYIAEHLSPQGRAAIIVPEGIIFQSQGAYVQLRKLLLENYLAAVISLPAGVFNPYSGVKTSILLLDRAVAQASEHVAFFKIENDGFALGAQRRAINGSQLPQVKADAIAWLDAARAERGEELGSMFGFSVTRERIADGVEYNLSGERYREDKKALLNVPRMPLGEVCTINPPKSETGGLPADTVVSFVPMVALNEWRRDFEPTETKPLAAVGASYTYFRDGDVLLAKVTPCFENGKAGIARNLRGGIGFGSSEFYVLRASEAVLPQWLYFCVTHREFREPAIAHMTGTGGLQRVPRNFVSSFQIPLPPLDVQREIVAETESYQNVIDGARAVVENYRPHIPIDPEWPVVELRSLIESAGVGVVKNKGEQRADLAHPYIKMNNITSRGTLELDNVEMVEATGDELARFTLNDGDLIYNTRNAPNLVGKSAVYHGPNGRFLFNNNICRIRLGDAADSDFVNWILSGPVGAKQIRRFVDGTTSVAALYQRNFEKILIPLPRLDTQRAIVAELDAERAMIDANRALIARFEKKIEAALARVWGEARELAETSVADGQTAVA
jgi:type I restriction enzyme M protein